MAEYAGAWLSAAVADSVREGGKGTSPVLLVLSYKDAPTSRIFDCLRS